MPSMTRIAIRNCPADGDLSELFTLEADFTQLNHGSYGGALRVAQLAADRWRAALDSCPSRFIEVRCCSTQCSRRSASAYAAVTARFTLRRYSGRRSGVEVVSNHDASSTMAAAQAPAQASCAHIC